MREPQADKKPLKILSYIYVVIFPLLIYLTFEILNTSSETPVKPAVLSSLPVVLISCLALMLIMALVFCLTGNIFVSGLLTSLCVGTLYVVNYYRLMLSGWVFVFSELSLASQLGNIAGFADLAVYPVMYLAALLLAAELVLLFLASRKVKLGLRPRMVCFAPCLAAALFLFCTNFSTGSILPRFNIDVKNKTFVNQTYKSSGVLMGFYTSYFYAQSEKPGNYDNALTNLADKLSTDTPKETASDLKPNVIIIMSEAFTDPSVLPNITYNKEPAHNFKTLQNSATSGLMLSPAFGGSTCNPEYEFLTGNALTFIGSNIMPYENEDKYILTDDSYALPQMFRDNGYKTVSVHPYKADFFHRNTIYPKLGFDRSIFLGDMDEPPVKGEFVSDEYFTDVMLNEINSTDEPLFLLGISMQNHYYFDPGKYQEYDVVCQSDHLNEFQLGSVDAYIQGIYDADKQLGRLIDEISKSGRPTIVLFFGDHLPLLGKTAYEVYSALDYIGGTDMELWSNEEIQKMFSTPYVVWNNFGAEKQDWGDVSPYFLGALAAKEAGIELNIYYEFLLQAYGSFHGLSDNLFIDSGNNIFSKPTSEALPVLEQLEALQYDRIFGR